MRTTLVQRAVAAYIGLAGLAGVLYANFQPTLPLIDRHLPEAYVALGILGLVAAVGILRRADWGRALGIAFMVLTLVIQVGRVIWPSIGAPAPPLQSAIVDWAISLPILAFILFELLRRWPFPARPAR